MRDVVNIEIDAPVVEVARLFTDPTQSDKWMDNTHYEPLDGDQGSPGSSYRLTLRDANMTFKVTVLERDAPNLSRLLLEAPNVNIQIRATFVPLGRQKTLLVSDELFKFRGAVNRAFGLLAWRSIRRAHRHQMQSFKRFAEGSVVSA
jgi:hypothetical protein